MKNLFLDTAIAARLQLSLESNAEAVKIVHSEAAAIPQGAEEFYSRLSGEKNKLWLEDVSQFYFYDNPEAVATASDAVVEYFEETL